ncbi:oligopeptide transport system ATP-binding protein [Desulfotomaculum arcticum]|uniref:Oligopeptide transport system ATP-binding protein n=1 Tax=Desulfotruncus arcticus DSM 17038 TaxID=1121424 RepID=A0A1I2XET6_9FIRM|nr:ABC transporter ATP-binding protein [Desulfotruncus arcticus]SFH11567.1 oligopeptide transport system ATP-binding protein [Desulfotomaculum arcticum] [Desulfotruncus arcticus DSM 17038]
MKHLLSVNNLQVHFKTFAGEVQAVRGVSFDLTAGEAIAIVGESGCGKSVTAQSIMRLIPSPPGRYVAGEIFFDGENLLPKTEKEMEIIRGKDIGMIFQDPMTSLNPTMKVGHQIVETLNKHTDLAGEAGKQRAVEMLALVGLPNPEKRYGQYPHQFSGGMRQRAMIAMALACNPRLLIADEPTTALDVTIQAQILELMQELKDKLGTSIILITHDLGVVAGFASRVIVMYAGKVVESGTTSEIFYQQRHPYTRGLLASVPRPGQEIRKKLSPIAGRPPDLIAPPQGCAFWPRCERAMLVCREVQPDLVRLSDTHLVSCWLTHEYASKGATIRS